MPAGAEPEAIAFYEGVLGLRAVPKPPVLAARGGCWFEHGAVVVHLGVDPSFVPATKAHPAFVVDDLDAVASSLAAAGVPFTFDDALEGVRRGYVADPFGNRIELIEDASSR
jgi:catechol 2,3-dioxygenase-like lactoylglutathione lyase family enzyme